MNLIWLHELTWTVISCEFRWSFLVYFFTGLYYDENGKGSKMPHMLKPIMIKFWIMQMDFFCMIDEWYTPYFRYQVYQMQNITHKLRVLGIITYLQLSTENVNLFEISKHWFKSSENNYMYCWWKITSVHLRGEKQRPQKKRVWIMHFGAKAKAHGSTSESVAWRPTTCSFF